MQDDNPVLADLEVLRGPRYESIIQAPGKSLPLSLSIW